MGDQEEIIEINNELERRIVDIFDVFDIAGNHTCDVREIGSIMRALGMCPTEAEVQEFVIKAEDLKAPGTIKLTKIMPLLVELLQEKKFEPASPEKLLEAFRTLDSENRGYLTKENFSKIMTESGEPFTQDELEEMLEIAIDPHNNMVPYEYYINQLMYEPKMKQDNYRLAAMIQESLPVVTTTSTNKFAEALEKAMSSMAGLRNL